MSYTAKQWSIAIRVADVLAAAVVLFVSYLTWSLYQQNGKVRAPVGYSTLLYIFLFFVIRGLAKKEKKKAEDAAAQLDASASRK